MSDGGRLSKNGREDYLIKLKKEFADLTRGEADSIFRTAAGLDRALDTLDRAREPKTSVTGESRKAKVLDGSRWLGLVKKIYGKENEGV